MTEILLKVALNIINQPTNQSLICLFNFYMMQNIDPKDKVKINMQSLCACTEMYSKCLKFVTHNRICYILYLLKISDLAVSICRITEMKSRKVLMTLKIKFK